MLNRKFERKKVQSFAIDLSQLREATYKKKLTKTITYKVLGFRLLADET